MKTAIITGASRGVGFSLAKLYAVNGWNLVINSGHNEPLLQNALSELTKLTCVQSCFGDIGLEATASHLIETALQAYGQIDLLINNAGISYIGLLGDMTSDEWHRVIQTNLDSVFYTSRAAIPSMVKRKTGHILNISSVWGEVGASCEAAYSASKGAVNALTRALAKELAPSGISVNAVSLGIIDTEMNRCFSQEERTALTDEIPAGRFASPEEAAEFCYHITRSPSYLTGQILRFDGGWI